MALESEYFAEHTSPTFWHVLGMAVILLGGFITIGWTAFVGWLVGRIFGLW